MGARTVSVAVVAVLLASACGQEVGTPAGPSVSSSPRETSASALDDPRAEGLPAPLVDPAEIRSGGPPPDGIPAIDAPKFLSARNVDFLRDQEPVVALRIGDDARAYPVQILTWHEIVNDTVGGIPVAVTYCPLCNSAIAYDRRAAGRVLDFGTSGKLYKSALVMYDRQTESLWSHFTAQAIAGVLTGTTLDVFPMSTVSWSDWRSAHPNGKVLSRETGFSRSYGRNPYPGYDDVNSPPFAFRGQVDGRLAAKERIVGLHKSERSVAVVLTSLLSARVVEIDLDGSAVVVWAKPGTASALDDETVEGGRDVGATGAFDPVLDGRRLRFEASAEGFRDLETASTWDVLGRATAGPLAGSALTPVEHVDTFWFAWAAYRPDTVIIGA